MLEPEKPTYQSYNQFLNNYGKKKFNPVQFNSGSNNSESTIVTEEKNKTCDQQTVDENPKSPKPDVAFKPAGLKPQQPVELEKSTESLTFEEEKSAVIAEIAALKPFDVPQGWKKNSNTKLFRPITPSNSSGYSSTETLNIDSVDGENKITKVNVVSNKEADLVTKVPVSDDIEKIDKNNPVVKKLVYGTYQNMLKTYNSKANEIIPKDKVVLDKGVVEQLNSLIAQGGIEHLTGRVNPNDTKNKNYTDF